MVSKEHGQVYEWNEAEGIFKKVSEIEFKPSLKKTRRDKDGKNS